MKLELPPDVAPVLLAYIDRVLSGFREPPTGAEFLAMREVQRITLHSRVGDRGAATPGPLLERIADPLARRLAVGRPIDFGRIRRAFERFLIENPQHVRKETDEILRYEDLLFLVAKGLFSPRELKDLVELLQRADAIDAQGDSYRGPANEHRVLTEEIQRFQTRSPRER